MASQTHGRRTIILLAAISALGSSAIHMVVPALPAIAGNLEISTRSAQHVVSFYLFGLATGQLFAGPLVDRIGRKPVLLCGVLLYTCAAILASLADGGNTLVGARIVQAFGASAGIVTSRVIVGDMFDKAEAGRRQATLMGVVLLSPAVAPVIGGFIVGAAGWRPILALQAALGLAALLAAARYLRESRSPVQAGPARSLAGGYLTLMRNSRFLRTSFAFSGASSALYMFLALSPFLFIQRWGLDSEQAGACFLAAACAGILGTRAVGWIEQRADALRVGLMLGVAGSCIALGFALAGVEHWAALLAPVLLMTTGAGISGPAGIAIIVHTEEGLAGTAASLSGAFQMGMAGFCSTAIGLIGEPSPILLGGGMACATIAALSVAPRTRKETGE